MKIYNSHHILRVSRYIMLVTAFLFCLGSGVFSASAKSTRAERQLITKGNKLYNDKKFVEAESCYKEALKQNSASAAGKYNLGLSQLRQVTNPSDTTPQTKAILENARKNFTEVASMAKEKPMLAAKANYNLGNLEFNAKEYEKAIQYYKQALRIDPSDNHARKNLRIAQKQLDNQNKDQNKDQQQNQQNQDKQDQNKDQQQNQQNQDQNKDQQQKPKDNEVNQQSAQRILQSIDNKENQTRARIQRANKGDKSAASGSNRKRW